ncbi:cyclic pyranopterin monophosphate synthase MoaC [Desulfolutivibrio sulfoxidireducens]|uniref:cyclic pyranopterin monophosphate synthase MoaC n=1 Tax=Desulfolutivibrio sulfoxidireducens TaxID=2773299 RepID=UPI00159D811E|nr:cyclic pyranopterin monophosphate synthase MoaC [Desulfolutivibrio sulfoxidireducens]QLA16298.1 cyclic pyranopterin monophosphate synthase MoaC [Desulfolutivibrio sulfoxidireducens]QLA19810.1 cyclic pyranopterin monophosphate synthase MoaC [Desulfolutivibrio sulfoxidireducens]
MSEELSHIDAQGKARMVDVGGKRPTRRIAVATARVVFSPATLSLLQSAALPKGDALATAKIAGVMAAKRTFELIPLCHPLPLSFVDVRFEVLEDVSTVVIEAEARTDAPTGVEMEALTAASVAALTLYDMCKAVQKDIELTGVRLLFKSGGKSGTFVSPLWPGDRPFPA